LTSPYKQQQHKKRKKKIRQPLLQAKKNKNKNDKLNTTQGSTKFSTKVCGIKLEVHKKGETIGNMDTPFHKQDINFCLKTQ